MREQNRKNACPIFALIELENELWETVCAEMWYCRFISKWATNNKTEHKVRAEKNFK